jgi:hypothetical protein
MIVGGSPLRFVASGADGTGMRRSPIARRVSRGFALLLAASSLMAAASLVTASPAEAAVRFRTVQSTVSCYWDVVGHGSAIMCVRARDGRQFFLSDTGDVFREWGNQWHGGRARRGRIDLHGGAPRYDVTCWATSTNVRCRHDASGHGFELGPWRAIRL